jgi:hypothetical protein
MRGVTYSMGVPLDGYIVGPDGGFDWTTPDEEVFRFATDASAPESSTSATAWRARCVVRRGQ